MTWLIDLTVESSERSLFFQMLFPDNLEMEDKVFLKQLRDRGALGGPENNQCYWHILMNSPKCPEVYSYKTQIFLVNTADFLESVKEEVGKETPVTRFDRPRPGSERPGKAQCPALTLFMGSRDSCWLHTECSHPPVILHPREGQSGLNLSLANLYPLPLLWTQTMATSTNPSAGTFPGNKL